MVIEHFMWGFQSHFRINYEVHAKSVFQLLDGRFQPEVFLVGILDGERKDRHPSCVEPERDFWIDSDAFIEVLSSAELNQEDLSGSRVHYSPPQAQQQESERLRRRAVTERIQSIIAASPDRPSNMRYFVSPAVARESYLICIVLGLQVDVINSHSKLARNTVAVHEYRTITSAVSLIDAAVKEFLQDAAGELLRPDAGENMGTLRTPGEVLRIAGARLMKDCAFKADRDLDQIGYWESMFDSCNALTELTYERTVGRGRLIVARRDHESINTIISFKNLVDLDNTRGARKLLQLASSKQALHMNAKSIFGLAELGDYDASAEDVFEIDVLDQHSWELSHGGQKLMHVHFGQPRLPAARFDSGKLADDLPRIFRGIETADVSMLVTLCEAAASEKHGTLLVIAEDAESEAARLGKQATAIEPRRATQSLIQQATTIDGAILLSPEGMCFAFGVILDGMATTKGDSARGARYNSAIRYVETRTVPCMAIVVSDDGEVDLIPDMLPSIPRAHVETAIKKLSEIVEGESIRRRTFNNLLSWLERHRFYLMEEHCVVINELVARIDIRSAAEEDSSIRIIRRPFSQHPQFDANIYYT